MRFAKQKIAFILIPVLYLVLFCILCGNFKQDFSAVQNHAYPVINLLYIIFSDIVLSILILVFTSNLYSNIAGGLWFVLCTVLYMPFNLKFGLFCDAAPLVESMLVTYVAALLVKYILKKSNKRLVNAIVGAYFSKKTGNKMLSGVIAECEPVKMPVTILECSVNNVESIIANNSPKEVFSKINFVLDAVINKIIENEGRVDKFIGTRIYAYWDKKDSAYLAVKAAMEALEFLDASAGEKDIKLSIGIHHDEVLTGLLGTPKVMNYSIVSSAIEVVDTIVATCFIYNKRLLISREVYKQGWRRLLAIKAATINIRGAAMYTDLYEPVEVKSGKAGRSRA